MSDIYYIDRRTKKQEKEQVYGKVFIEILYGKNWIAHLFSFLLLPLFCKISWVSKLYGKFQRSPYSRCKIKPFIDKFRIDTSEFLDSVETFHSFNDFFIRKLKPSSRPIAIGDEVAILPADGRYLVYPIIQKADGFLIKGQKFSLGKLLLNPTLAHKYEQGAMVLARLCPIDYHRFHFPADCIAETPVAIPGDLFSVNPMALKKNIEIITQNKRAMTMLHTKRFGTILYIEVGATYVGSIHQTFTPGQRFLKGQEKGYFSFGGSCLILLFEPFRIEFDQDLLDASKHKIEIRGLLGQSLGKSLT
ncbi:MAG: phosphatidylserine decarboxylase, partial [Anaerolineae bacterium]